MMRLVLLSFFLVACSNTDKIPKDVLPPHKMAAVLYDVVRVDEMVDFLSIQDSVNQKLSTRINLYDTVFSIHAINKQIFKNSLSFYQGRPDLLKSILDSLQKKSAADSLGKPDSAVKRKLFVK